MRGDADVVAETLVEYTGMNPVDARRLAGHVVAALDARVGLRLSMTTAGQVARRDAIVADAEAKLAAMRAPSPTEVRQAKRARRARLRGRR